MTEAPSAKKIVRYTVNAEPQETDDHKLSVRDVLTRAGFTPAEDYELTRDDGHKALPDLDEEIPIHEGESFTATFTGPTPTS